MQEFGSIAEQDVDQLGGAISVLARQKKDHITLDRLLHELAEASGQSQAAVLSRIYRLVFPHAFAEESVLWPVMRRSLPDGHELTDPRGGAGASGGQRARDFPGGDVARRPEA